MSLVGQFIKVRAQAFVGRPNSDGGVGNIIREHEDGSFDIVYVIDMKTEKNVARERIESTNPLVLTARRRDDNELVRPSILAPSHVPESSTRNCPLSPHQSPPPSPSHASDIIRESRGWGKYDTKPNPLLVFLQEGRKKAKGWLRVEEKEYDTYTKDGKGKKKGEMKTQLSEKENNKLVHIKMEIDRVGEIVNDWPASYNPIADLSYAYGISRRKVVDSVDKYVKGNCATKRKVRSDAGRTLFNSQQMRNKLYTPYNHFKKLQRKRNPGEMISDNDLKVAWEQSTPQVKHQCELGADEEKMIAVNFDAQERSRCT